MQIKEIPVEERPRERLLKVGVKNLSNEELLAILLKTGHHGISVKELALQVLKRIDNIYNINDLNMETLKDIKGLGPVKTMEILAVIELGKRLFLEKKETDNIRFTSPEIIFKYNKHLFWKQKQEYFYCLYLDNQNKLLERKLLFMGTINRSIVHPREIFKEAYLLSASKIICLHNHPSGDLKPSKEDLNLTRNLIEIGRMQGINIMDHLIITDEDYYSFYDNTDLFL